MYPPIDAIVEHARSGRQRHPLIMCEYSHAMGNSNGTLAEYWEAIEADARTAGRVRLGVVRPRAAPAAATTAPIDGRTAATSATSRTTAPSCLDGMLFPDRTPKPAMAEHRQLAAPVRLHRQDGGAIEVENRQDERDLGWLRVSAARTVGDGASTPLEIVLPATGPGERSGLAVDVKPPEDGEAWLVLDVETATDQAWAPAGTPICHAQLQLREEDRPLLARAGARLGPGPVTLDDDGLLRHPLLAAPPVLSLWRAPTDNDRIGGMARRWLDLGLPAPARQVRDVAQDAGGTVVRSVYRTGAGIEVEHEQRFTPVLAADGAGLLVEETATVPAELDDLPRIGTVLELVPGLEQVRWFGPGPFESYPDRRAAGAIGWHGGSVAQLQTAYLRPQENGGRHGVRRFAVSGGDDGGRVEVVLDVPRQVSWSHHRAADLDSAGHAEDLAARQETVVHLDAAHRGVGTASCGPDTLPSYLLGPGTYRWSWVLLAGG